MWSIEWSKCGWLSMDIERSRGPLRVLDLSISASSQRVRSLRDAEPLSEFMPKSVLGSGEDTS